MIKSILIKFVVLIIAGLSCLKAIDLTDYITEITADPNLDSESLYQFFRNYQDYDDPEISGDLQIGYNTINDTLEAPFIYFLPSNYDPLKSTPLLINLHGGVGRQEFILDPLEVFKQDSYLPICESESWILLIPLGNADCMWWDRAGMQNITTLILKMKNEFNIDDDRVYLTGFSDGGSGSFHFALNDPGYFAGFYPLNGMLTVGSAVTGIPVYPANLANRPVYAINTDEDGLYPAAEMRKLMQLSLNAGADLFYREYWGYGHSFDYADQELPLMINHMKRTSRNPFPEKIYWECHEPASGCCDWLKITELDTLKTPADWHLSYNTKLTDTRIQFGFFHDQDYQGNGIRISGIAENSAAAAMDLQPGDVITGMDGSTTDSLAALLDLRDRKSRGDGFILQVNRDGKEIKLSGSFPEVYEYDAFNYSSASGAVKATYAANTFFLETSRVAALELLISPEMVNLEIPVTVIHNGKQIFSEMIEFERNYLIRDFSYNKDKKAIWVNKISFRLD